MNYPFQETTHETKIRRWPTLRRQSAPLTRRNVA
jgi:hypothetical protein